ncbi:MAG: galactose oxidase early set domain-containing protein [Burkholderiaceae bacterium]
MAIAACSAGGGQDPLAGAALAGGGGQDTVTGPAPAVDPAPSSPNPTPPAPPAPEINNKALAITVDNSPEPWLTGLSPTPDADTKGMWSAPVDWPLVAIHAAMLPNGKVATFGTPLGDTLAQAARLFDVWDPLAGFGAGSHSTVLNANNVDSFCSGATLMSSGKLLVTGGNSTLDSVLLDVTNQSVVKNPQFSSERWYSTVLSLADGRPIILGGGDYYNGSAYKNPDWYDDGLAIDVTDGVAMTPEVYVEGSGWQLLQGATSRGAFGPDLNRYFYPRAWVARDGNVFGLSSDNYWRLDPNANGGQGSIEVLGTFHPGISETTLPNIGPTSSAVMFAPGKILQTGGNGYTNGANSETDFAYDHRTTSSARATLFDIGDGSIPTIVEKTSMTHARQWHNVTVLPNGRVLANGGTRIANYGGTTAVKQAEIWDPARNVWDEMSGAARVRVYHSTSLLLPSGAVFTGGGGVPGPVSNLDAEIFYPPYLFERDNGSVRLAVRPTILSLSSRQLTYGSSLKLQLDRNEQISEVAILGLGNVTHANNPGQRRVPLTFTQDDFMLEVEMPENGAISPPGFYMVVVLDAEGIPSRGVIIGLAGNPT